MRNDSTVFFSFCAYHYVISSPHGYTNYSLFFCTHEFKLGLMNPFGAQVQFPDLGHFVLAEFTACAGPGYQLAHIESPVHISPSFNYTCCSLPQIGRAHV